MAPTATLADALSTALLVQQALALATNLEDQTEQTAASQSCLAKGDLATKGEIPFDRG